MRTYMMTRAELVTIPKEVDGKSGKYIRFGLRDSRDGHITECVIYEDSKDNPNLFRIGQKILKKGDKYNITGRPNYVDKVIRTNAGNQHIEQEIVNVNMLELDKDIEPKSNGPMPFQRM